MQDTPDTEERMRMLARVYSQKVRYLRELQIGKRFTAIITDKRHNKTNML